MPLAKPTKPDSITAVPTPVPQRTDRANFAARGDAMMGWFPDGVDEINTTSDYMDDAANFAEQEANEAEASATAAEASNVAAGVNAAAAAASAGATVWVTGSTYTAGVVRYSPTNFSTYRDTVGGLSSTDPASDTTGRWQSAMLPSAEAIALPALLPTIAINALSGASNVSVQVTRAMEKYRYNRLGYLVADAAGVLGVDHDPLTKAPRGWKIDPQTVYLAMRSTEMDNAAYWLATNLTVTPASRVGIDNTMSMFKVEVNLSATSTSIRRDAVVTAPTQYVAFRVAKGNSANSLNTFRAYNLSTAANLIVFTLNYDTGVITHSIGSGATAAPVGNGIWEVRYSISGVTIGNTVAFYCGAAGEVQPAGTYFYASHFDVSDKPNASPHPTAGSNITRPADVLTVTGPDFSDNYNQAEGTFFVAAEMPIPPDASRILVLVDDGTASNTLYVQRDNVGVISAITTTGGVNSGAGTASTTATALFVVCSYKAADWRLTVRGVAASATTPTPPAAPMTRLVIGSTALFNNTELGGWLKALYYYPIAVSAGESRALVTHA